MFTLERIAEGIAPDSEPRYAMTQVTLPEDLAVVVASGWCVPGAIHEVRSAKDELASMRFDPNNFGSIMHEELEAALAFIVQFYDVEESIKRAKEHHTTVWVNALNPLTGTYHTYSAESVEKLLAEDRARIDVNYIIRLREMFPLHTEGYARYYAVAAKQLG